MSSPQPFLLFERVRWADVDVIGIMRFSAFTRLIEMAEQELLRAAGLPFSKLFDAPRVLMPRRHLSIEYFAPARLDEELALVSYVSHMGETSMTFTLDVRDRARWRLVASASMVVVCVGVEDFAKRPLPQSARDALAPFHCAIEWARRWAPTPAEGVAKLQHD